jgi:lactoylglutathione lyase
MKRMQLLLMTIGLAMLTGQSLHAAEPAPRVSYVALNVFDEKRALDFYVGVLGMSERRRVVPIPALTEILLGFTKNPDDPGVLLMVRTGRDKPYEMGDAFSRFIIDVPNLDATVKRLSDAGVKLLRPITEVKDLQLKYAMVKDPDGFTIELIQHL